MKSKRRMPRRTWSSGRGALFVVSMLLVSSAVIRLTSGTGAAIALELETVAESFTPPQSEEAAATNVAPELAELLQRTRKKELELREREAALESRMQVLALVEATVNEDIERLKQAEADLRATMAMADQAAEQDIARLTAVYENMKPEQAAVLFQKMEPSFAAGFLGRMRADAAAAILAGLEPDLAYSISVVLAGRNADVPREPVPPPVE